TPHHQISPGFRLILRDTKLNEGITDPQDKVVLHTLRHTYASWLVQAGLLLYTVQRLMGRKSIIMTQRYAHLAPDQGAEAARHDCCQR
nr:tyrosine-type recombinase/integrase [Desulfovibrio sp.]